MTDIEEKKEDGKLQGQQSSVFVNIEQSNYDIMDYDKLSLFGSKKVSLKGGVGVGVESRNKLQPEDTTDRDMGILSERFNATTHLDNDKNQEHQLTNEHNNIEESVNLEFATPNLMKLQKNSIG